MKVKLELMDWKKIEEETINLIRANQINLRINKRVLDYAQKEIAKFTNGAG